MVSPKKNIQTTKLQVFQNLHFQQKTKHNPSPHAIGYRIKTKLNNMINLVFQTQFPILPQKFTHHYLWEVVLVSWEHNEGSPIGLWELGWPPREGNN